MEAFVVLAVVIAFIVQCAWFSLRSFGRLIQLQRTGAIRGALSPVEYRRAEAPRRFWFLVAYHLLMAFVLGAIVLWLAWLLAHGFIQGLLV